MDLREWKRMAEALDLEWHTGSSFVFDLPEVLAMTAGTAPAALRQAQQLREGGLLGGMLGSLIDRVYPGGAVGAWRGFQVAIFPHQRESITDTSRNYWITELALIFPESLDLALTIKPRHFLTGVARALFGGFRYPEDPALDRLVSVTCNAAEDETERLRTPEVRAALTHAFTTARDLSTATTQTDLRVRDLGTHCSFTCGAVEAEAARAVLDAMSRIASALSSAASRDGDPEDDNLDPEEDAGADAERAPARRPPSLDPAAQTPQEAAGRVPRRGRRKRKRARAD